MEDKMHNTIFSLMSGLGLGWIKSFQIKNQMLKIPIAPKM